MYNYNTTSLTSDLKLVLRNKGTYEYYSNVIAKLQRRYLAEGIWRTVQMDESGDFGNVFFNVKEQNTDYRILYFDRDNNLLKQTESLKFICTNGVCELTQLLSPFEETTLTTDLDVSYDLHNDTRIIEVNWSDPLGGNNKVEVRVTKETMTGSISICNIFQTGSSGTANCNVSLYAGDVLLSVLTSNSPYVPVDSFWITLSRGLLSSYISKTEASFWTFGFMVTVAGFGVWSPVAALISVMAGLISLFFMGIFNPLTITFIVVAASMGIAIGIKIKK